MTPVEKGAFCQSCKKEVTGFSGISDKEIADQLAGQQFQSACDRFRKDQLNRPLIDISHEVLLMDIPTWKKFLPALFICFSGLLTGCKNNSTSTDITEAVTPAYIVESRIDTTASVNDVKDTTPSKIFNG